MTLRRLRHPGAAAPADLAVWRRPAVERLRALLGLDPVVGSGQVGSVEVPPQLGTDPELVDVRTGDGSMPAWLLTPAAGSTGDAAVVALAGHGPGIDALVSTEADGDYHGAVARKLQAAGFTVLCPELSSFGRRRTPSPADHPTPTDPEPPSSSCQIDAMRGLLTGRPVLGRRVSDALAAVTAAGGLPWVDPAKVAVLGGSGGGAVSLLAAALDDRIPVAVVANYISSFAASLCSVPHCICNAVPELSTWFEMADLAAMIAPRGLIIEAGERDPIFPVSATRATYGELVEVWSGSDRDSTADVRRPELIVTDAGHQFVADEAIESLAARLGVRRSPARS